MLCALIFRTSWRFGGAHRRRGRRGEPDSAIAVVVDEEGADCRMCNDEYRELAATLATALAERGIELLAAHVVDRVAAGGRWHCADGCGNAGTVDDPSASPLAVAAVLDGRRLYARRAELQEVIAVADPARSAALAERDRAAAAGRSAGYPTRAVTSSRDRSGRACGRR